MIHLGLIGYPLGHSLSPKLHNAALRYYGLQGEYSLFSIEPHDLQSLKDLLGRVRSDEITGLNVTIPHKQNVIPFLDELTNTAEAIGAVNTIYLRNNKLIGDNTDAPGFLADLKKVLTQSPSHGTGEGIRVREKKALVLGAGGSARAVVYALLKDGWNVILAARRIRQAQQFVDLFTNYQLQIADFALSKLELSNITLIVNATPVGMVPSIEQSPWPKNFPFPQHATIYDLVYYPYETKFVKDARAQGLSAITGKGMLIEQAALAFELWTGKQVSREIMSSAMEAL
ncbi:MAG: shikimate dehydrogenase [Anaerolineales bacterium]